ncbi:MAG: hypothetical protein P4M01_03845 [Acidobacteriota bacterium]|nr:hypothetical protein [Acidobacteriota bacterium]
MLNRETVLEEIERLSASAALHHSESLCKLLRYLAEQSLDNPGATIKEYQIATEVFHRSTDFDPQLDSVIRVQAGRLRTKLAAYYSSEGEEDRVFVELPKGNYTLHFRENPKKIKSPETPAEVPAEDHSAFAAAPNSRRPSLLVPVLGFLLLLAVAIIAALLLSRKPVAAAPALLTPAPAPAPYRLFWGRFLASPEEPWVVFSNATFVGRPETGLRYANAAATTPAESQGKVFDHYTGVGEVLAVHEIDGVFAALHAHARVKRGSLFSLDDLKQNNLIFLGSPAENLTLRDIPTTTSFVFKRLTEGPRKGDLSIANVAPQPGEPQFSLASPSEQTLTEDYAIIGLKRGNESSRLVLIVAGTTTFGTEGGVEYLCRPESLQDLLNRLGVKKPEDLSPFEALLRIRISRGVPVETTLIALRKEK